jgi:hypothetical protein
MSTNDPTTRTYETGKQGGQEHERQRNQEAAQQNQGVSDQIRQTTHQAQETAKTMLASQKVQAAEGLNSLAQALRQTGQSLRQQDQATIADYTNRAAEQINSLSATLRDKDFDEILQDVEDFARRRPEVVLGGAVAVGFLLARFLKSHSPHRDMYNTYGGGYGQSYGRYDRASGGGYGRQQNPYAQGYGQTTTGYGRTTGQQTGRHVHESHGQDTMNTGHSPYRGRQDEATHRPREQGQGYDQERSTQPTRPDLGRRTGGDR